MWKKINFKLRANRVLASDGGKEEIQSFSEWLDVVLTNVAWRVTDYSSGRSSLSERAVENFKCRYICGRSSERQSDEREWSREV